MTKINEIKAKLNSVEKLNLNDDCSTLQSLVLVIAGIDTSKAEEKVIAFVEKKNLWNDLEKYVDERVKISNRVKHSFVSLDDMNAFMANNECGEMWDENGEWCVYAY